MVNAKKKRRIYGLYLVLISDVYPKWLAMNFTAAILFVIANLGMPTVLARMIDEELTVGMLTSFIPMLGSCLVWS